MFFKVHFLSLANDSVIKISIIFVSSSIDCRGGFKTDVRKGIFLFTGNKNAFRHPWFTRSQRFVKFFSSKGEIGIVQCIERGKKIVRGFLGTTLFHDMLPVIIF